MAEIKKTSVAPTPKQIREARAYLQNRQLTSADVAPKDFATLSNRWSKSFAETLRLLARLKMGGQGGSPFEETKEALREIEK